MDSLSGELAGAPLIGVTTSEVRRAETISPIPEGEPPMHEMALGLTYLRAIEATGGMPVVIPPLRLELIGPLLDRLAGICLSGGPDLHPEAYGQEPDEHLGPTEPDLDRFELAIASAADQRDMPMLAICRGTQALNVVRGGTLVQHLPALRDRAEGDGVPHRQTAKGSEPSHSVAIEPDSLLAATIGTDSVGVNSFHHQAIDRLGRDLVPTARAADGTIEAVEDRGRSFLIGVQWHAELLIDRPEEQALFGAFVAAAAAESAARSPGRTLG
ncbi:MAG: gamma-glutamyl-gamma-aminobutyrate hydrolase family protein [Solirubrobacterales bacterium]